MIWLNLTKNLKFFRVGKWAKKNVILLTTTGKILEVLMTWIGYLGNSKSSSSLYASLASISISLTLLLFPSSFVLEFYYSILVYLSVRNVISAYSIVTLNFSGFRFQLIWICQKLVSIIWI